MDQSEGIDVLGERSFVQDATSAPASPSFTIGCAKTKVADLHFEVCRAHSRRYKRCDVLPDGTRFSMIRDLLVSERRDVDIAAERGGRRATGKHKS